MTVALRPIQVVAREKIRAAFREGHKRIVAVAPTGFGKTVLLADVIANHVEKVGWVKARALIVVHRRELIAQSYAKLAAAGVPGVNVKVKTVQALLSEERPTATMLILDEAHHYVAEEWGRVAASYPGIPVLGFTATPMRDDGKPLGDIFTKLVVLAQTHELMALEQLTRCTVFAAMRRTKDLSEQPLEAYELRTKGRPAVVFCQSVEAAYAQAELFTAAGYPAACIEGAMKAEDRDSRLAAFASGALTVLTNVYVLTEGWDCPRAEVCILARGCESVGAFLQMVGRVLRVSPGKERAYLIDLRGAVHKHGLPDQAREFSLEGRAISGAEAPTKICRSCGAVNHAAARVCEACGAEFPVAEPTGEDVAPVIEIDSVPTEQECWDEWCAIAADRGYKPGWIVRQFVAKFGRFPRKLWKSLGVTSPPLEGWT
jgi:superfamily II DNA or RNA helicase